MLSGGGVLMFAFAMQKSFEELSATIANATNDLNDANLKEEVNLRLGTYIHWMMDYWERIEKSDKVKITEDHKSLFSAFRYANNELKHGKNLVTLYQRTGGLSFPFSFPISFERIEFKWATLELSKKARLSQFANYQSYLDGKPLLDTIIEAKDIIGTYIAIS
jgi:hypothetical protein